VIFLTIALRSDSKGSGTTTITTIVTVDIPVTTTSEFATQKDAFILQELRFTTDLAVVSPHLLSPTRLLHTKPTTSAISQKHRTGDSAVCLRIRPCPARCTKLFLAFICWMNTILEIYSSPSEEWCGYWHCEGVVYGSGKSILERNMPSKNEECGRLNAT
jgi:hypothetical protein